MAIVRVLKALNCKVVADCLFNDRGIHICKALFGYLKENNLEKPINEVLDEWYNNQSKWPVPKEGEYKDSFVGKYYVLGVKYEANEEYKKEIQ